MVWHPAREAVDRLAAWCQAHADEQKGEARQRGARDRGGGAAGSPRGVRT